MNLTEKLNETINFIRTKTDIEPKIGIILGTGLGAVADKISNAIEIDYKDIPNFPVSTAIGHAGKLILGEVSDKQVITMEGRFHFYEGYTIEQVTYAVRVMKQLGVEILLVSNAAGGINADYTPGDLVAIIDHINLMGTNPLIGPNYEELGPRFPDMYEPYDLKLVELALTISREEDIRLHKGVYVGVTGPCLETKAEYKFLRTIGADLVGMSTVPEVIVAVHTGIKVLGISCVTDRCVPEELKPCNIDEIIKVANQASPKITKLIMRVIEKL